MPYGSFLQRPLYMWIYSVLVLGGFDLGTALYTGQSKGVFQRGWAQSVHFEIVYPVDQTCVPNANRVQPGPLPGEESEFERSRVPLSLELGESRGANLTLSAVLNGVPVDLTANQVNISGIQPDRFDFISIPSDAIQDGSHVLEITATSVLNSQGGVLATQGGQTVSTTRTVRFDLDRLPPEMTFTPQQAALFSQCGQQQADDLLSIVPILSDEYDQNPTLDILESELECEVTRIFMAQDHCGAGNVQEVFFSVNRPAITPPTFDLSVDEGDTFLETYLLYNNLSGFGCYTLTAFLSNQDDPDQDPQEIPSNYFLDQPGSYQLNVVATDCAGTQHTETRNFTILDLPRADAGGPYQVDQGTPLNLDGSASTSPPQLGPISEYAWNLDLNNPLSQGYQTLGPQVVFNAPDDGLFNISLRTTIDITSSDPNQGGNNTPVGSCFPNPCGEGSCSVRQSIDCNSIDCSLLALEETISCDCRSSVFSGPFCNQYIAYDFTEVHVNDLPPICDAGGPYEIQQGEFLTFDGSGSRPGVDTEEIIGYHWNFGDLEGDLGERFGPSLDDPRYLYQEEGTYEVTLTIYDIDSSCTTTTSVVVVDSIPVIRGLGPQGEGPWTEGESITFNAGQQTESAEGFVSFHWDFGDGHEEEGPNLRFVEHTYTQSGEFNVCLTVDDGDSLVEECVLITVQDLAPFVYFDRVDGQVGALEGQTSVVFSLDGTRAGGSVDPLQSVIIRWGDGEVSTLTPNELSLPLSHVFQADGDLTIEVEAQDEDSSSFLFFPLYVEDATPIAVIRQVSPTRQEGIEVEWSALESQAGSNSDQIVNYYWDFGDGTTLSGFDQSVVRHTWQEDGIYSLRLSVEDVDGSIDSQEIEVSIQNRPPFNTSIEVSSSRVDFGEPVHFEVFYEDVFNDSVQIYWRMGEGTEYENRRQVTHRYTELGLFTVRVVLTDDDGGETLVQTDIEVTPAGPRIIMPALDPVAEGETLSFDVELQAASDGEGNLDGPVDLNVFRAPPTLQWTELSRTSERSRYRFEWIPGPNDAGRHPLKIGGTAPSRIQRSIEHILHVTPAQTVQLAILGGNASRSTLSLFEYQSSRGLSSLTPLSFEELGAGIGQMALYQDWIACSVPGSSSLVFADQETGRVIRTLKQGRFPYALVQSQGRLWSFDALTGSVSIINRHLKIEQTLFIDGLNGVSNALAFDLDGQPVLALIDRSDMLHLLDPSLLLNYQIQQAYYRTPFSIQSKRLNPHPSSRQLHLWSERNQLVVGGYRQIQGYPLDALFGEDPRPVWAISTGDHLNDFTLQQGIDQEWVLLGGSSAGLTQFILPPEDEQRPLSEDDLDRLDIQSGNRLLSQPQRALVDIPSSLFGQPALLALQSRQINHVSLVDQSVLLSREVLNPYRVILIIKSE